MKITKNTLKKLIKEEITQGAGPLSTIPNQNAVLRNYGPSGKPPDNQSRQTIGTRPPYETLGVEVSTNADDTYITIGKIVYMLKFDNEDLTSGHVVPIGEYKFTIDGGVINWLDNVPTHVRFDSQLEKQVLEFSGREE